MKQTNRMAVGVCVAMLAAAPGCESLIKRDRKRQLERVARDWTMTIRASQVVPVYPLTQDFQPGDVFLVQQSVKEQEATFDAKGFLPIDMQIARIDPTGYAAFYDAYVLGGETTSARLPGDWRAPNAEKSWAMAPRAGFPTYEFEVSASAGLSLAVPVQAVPVGLSLLGASKATGSVTIADAFTYGIDVASLHEQVHNSDEIQSFLREVVVPEGETYYVRVISRVFATKDMVVTLTTDSNAAGGLDVGVPKPVGVSGGQPSSIDQVNAINTALEGMKETMPGGSVRAVSAQNRSITFNEKFAEPIVFGYHGFDMAILADKSLGPVVPTFLVLDSGAVPPATALTEEDIGYLALLELLRAIESADPVAAAEVVDGAAGQDAAFRRMYEVRRSSGMGPVDAWVQALLGYMDEPKKRKESMARLDAARGWLARAAKESELDLQPRAQPGGGR